MSKQILSICGVVLALSACASFPPPTDTLANSLASMRGAEEIGAQNVPQASLQLQLAQDGVNKAKALMADGANERAHYMALRAGHDAELAIALTRENNARSEAEQAKQRVEDARSTEVAP